VRDPDRFFFFGPSRPWSKKIFGLFLPLFVATRFVLEFDVTSRKSHVVVNHVLIASPVFFPSSGVCRSHFSLSLSKQRQRQYQALTSSSFFFFPVERTSLLVSCTSDSKNEDER